MKNVSAIFQQMLLYKLLHKEGGGDSGRRPLCRKSQNTCIAILPADSYKSYFEILLFQKSKLAAFAVQERNTLHFFGTAAAKGSAAETVS